MPSGIPLVGGIRIVGNNISRSESPISSDSVSQANSLHRSEGSSRRQGQDSFRIFGTPKKVCF